MCLNVAGANLQCGRACSAGGVRGQRGSVVRSWSPCKQAGFEFRGAARARVWQGWVRRAGWAQAGALAWVWTQHGISRATGGLLQGKRRLGAGACKAGGGARPGSGPSPLQMPSGLQAAASRVKASQWHAGACGRAGKRRRGQNSKHQQRRETGRRSAGARLQPSGGRPTPMRIWTGGQGGAQGQGATPQAARWPNHLLELSGVGWRAFGGVRQGLGGRGNARTAAAHWKERDVERSCALFKQVT